VSLASVAEAVLGPLWVSQLARLTGTPARTVQRIRARAGEGREHPKAQAVADAFLEAMRAAVVRVDALATVRETVKRRGRAKAGKGRVLGDGEREAFMANRPDLRDDS